MKRLRLVDNWKSGWAWFSVHAAGVCAILPEIYEHVDLLQDFLDDSQFRHVQFGLGLVVIAARFVKQS